MERAPQQGTTTAGCTGPQRGQRATTFRWSAATASLTRQVTRHLHGRNSVLGPRTWLPAQTNSETCLPSCTAGRSWRRLGAQTRAWPPAGRRPAPSRRCPPSPSPPPAARSSDPGSTPWLCRCAHLSPTACVGFANQFPYPQHSAGIAAEILHISAESPSHATALPRTHADVILAEPHRLHLAG